VPLAPPVNVVQSIEIKQVVAHRLVGGPSPRSHGDSPAALASFAGVSGSVDGVLGSLTGALSSVSGRAWLRSSASFVVESGLPGPTPVWGRFTGRVTSLMVARFCLAGRAGDPPVLSGELPRSEESDPPKGTIGRGAP
jgi:hypothetical protein